MVNTTQACGRAPTSSTFSALPSRPAFVRVTQGGLESAADTTWRDSLFEIVSHAPPVWLTQSRERHALDPGHKQVLCRGDQVRRRKGFLRAGHDPGLRGRDGRWNRLPAAKDSRVENKSRQPYDRLKVMRSLWRLPPSEPRGQLPGGGGGKQTGGEPCKFCLSNPACLSRIVARPPSPCGLYGTGRRNGPANLL